MFVIGNRRVVLISYQRCYTGVVIIRRDEALNVCRWDVENSYVVSLLEIF